MGSGRPVEGIMAGIVEEEGGITIEKSRPFADIDRFSWFLLKQVAEIDWHES